MRLALFYVMILSFAPSALMAQERILPAGSVFEYYRIGYTFRVPFPSRLVLLPRGNSMTAEISSIGRENFFVALASFQILAEGRLESLLEKSGFSCLPESFPAGDFNLVVRCQGRVSGTSLLRAVSYLKKDGWLHVLYVAVPEDRGVDLEEILKTAVYNTRFTTEVP